MFRKRQFHLKKATMNKIDYYGLEPTVLPPDSNEDTSEDDPEILEDSDGNIEINIYAPSPEES